VVVRVHPTILCGQKLRAKAMSERVWDERIADIAHMEDYRTRHGTIILKFFLNVSCGSRERD
jgi:polyphosphate kinase 2 (PPK2 family)